MSIFEKGEKMLRAAYQFAARNIDYRRGETFLVHLPAKLGKTIFRYQNSSGITVREEQRDFILRSEDLNIEPMTGDEIVFDGEIFVVCAPNKEPCWRWHTRRNSEIRIHTKSVGRE
ncbi:MAG: hypothetical protein E7047_03870 [Lentisphaerae bacterium]|nr:hypothetical protein [Lentisphaerota bacterium]